MPPSVAVASTWTIAPWRWQSFPISSSGCAIVVEVSPWQTATSLGETRFSATSTCAGSNTVPHSASTTCTSAPMRRAISVMSWPKRPKERTSTLSPGSTADTITHSIAARAVPSTTIVQRFFVSKTRRYSSIVSFM